MTKPTLARFLKYYILAMLFFNSILMTSCLGKSKKNDGISKALCLLTHEERAHLESFFKYLFLENYGVYALFGSKPMCAAITIFDVKTVERKWEERWANMSLKEQQEYLQQHEESTSEFNMPDYYCGWKAWEKINPQLPLKRFLLFSTPDPNNRGSYEIFLVNILETALVLSENYQLFKSRTGMDFDPFEIVFDLKNPNSCFWEKVFAIENHLLKGLVLGYGFKNSQAFEWEMKEDWKSAPAAMFWRNNSLNCSVEKDILPGRGNLDNFTIPRFGYVECDHTIEKYRAEKKQILKKYSSGDFLKITLEGLTN